MKLIVIAAIFALAVAAPWQQEIIDQVNSKNGATWFATHNPVFDNMDRSDAIEMLGLLPVDTLSATGDFPVQEASLGFVPKESFHVSELYNGADCDLPIRDQGKCGSCWAFGAAEALSERFCIATGEPTVLSPQWLVSCDKYGNFGCNGGMLPATWAYLGAKGIPEDDCLPYTSGTTSKSGKCPKTCEDGSEPNRYRVKVTSIRVYSGAEAIQEALQNGPVETGFTVYEDFMAYGGGIYSHEQGSALGGHAVAIVGWGTEDGTDYWLVKNSWSAFWGDEGFFKIVRGTNECGFEGGAMAGMPKV
eukprot:TRINITY_DN2462_c0_g1_i1.p1 TRINITY_DN2462_c0_g1~~TRINITY_DN2462_c0_g1_i1.p1  ORF type:complete len:304 (+),score=56.18 TRINITY_DN2462_c0_g1_i1:1-912(+)